MITRCMATIRAENESGQDSSKIHIVLAASERLPSFFGIHKKTGVSMADVVLECTNKATYLGFKRSHCSQKNKALADHSHQT